MFGIYVICVKCFIIFLESIIFWGYVFKYIGGIWEDNDFGEFCKIGEFKVIGLER